MRKQIMAQVAASFRLDLCVLSLLFIVLFSKKNEKAVKNRKTGTTQDAKTDCVQVTDLLQGTGLTQLDEAPS